LQVISYAERGRVVVLLCCYKIVEEQFRKSKRKIEKSVDQKSKRKNKNMCTRTITTTQFSVVSFDLSFGALFLVNQVHDCL